MRQENWNKLFKLQETIAIFIKNGHEILNLWSESLEAQLLHDFANLVDWERTAAIWVNGVEGSAQLLVVVLFEAEGKASQRRHYKFYFKIN